MLNFKILNGKSLFFSKKHAQKTPIKNKKKCHSAKKISKVTQNQEQASELPSQVNHASVAILKSHSKLVSQQKTGKQYRASKRSEQAKRSKQTKQIGQSKRIKQAKQIKKAKQS